MAGPRGANSPALPLPSVTALDRAANNKAAIETCMAMDFHNQEDEGLIWATRDEIKVIKGLREAAGQTDPRLTSNALASGISAIDGHGKSLDSMTALVCK